MPPRLSAVPPRRHVLRACAVSCFTGAAGCLSTPDTRRGDTGTDERTGTPSDSPDPTPGTVAWRRSLPGTVSTDPVLAGDQLLVGTESGTVAALSPSDGRVRWQFEGDGQVRGTPTVAGDAVLAVAGRVEMGSHDTLFALDAASGETAWEYAGDGELQMPAVGTHRAYTAKGSHAFALAV